MIPAFERLFKTSVAYRQCFLNDKGELTPAARIVMADLERFAGVMNGPTVVSPVTRTVDPLATQQRVGRADMLYRAWKMLRLPLNKIHELHGELND